MPYLEIFGEIIPGYTYIVCVLFNYKLCGFF